MTRRVGFALVFSVGLACGSDAAPTAETRARDAFVERVAAREGLLDVWSLMSRADLIFGEGLSAIEMIDPAPATAWHDVAPSASSARALPVRWMAARALIHVRATEASRLEVRGRVDVQRLQARPRITATFDGIEFASDLVASDGTFAIAIDVSRDRLSAWSAVYLTLSSVAEPWRDPTALRIARVEWVSWRPVTVGGPSRSPSELP